MSVAVLTLAHGRHDHLRGQIAGLAGGVRRPDLHVVAAIDDPDVARVAREAWDEHDRPDRPDPPAGPGAGPRPAPGAATPRLLVVEVEADPQGLPLALARNTAATTAVRHGAQTLVFLDVDCIPGPGTVETYADALAAPRDDAGPLVLGGDVAYLPPREQGWSNPAELVRLGEHRPDRVRLTAGEQRREPDLTRFWSLSFATTAEDLQAVGGFCTDYVGYGGEDTDFGQLLGARGGRLVWVGGATAYHQHHPSSSPPVAHLAAVVRNAGVFADRWGWWPMEGWLEAFRRLGLAEQDRSGRWVVSG
ncbi:galactosyltransferase-related protein [uncultured Serinicoccus sp.]|uniref:glycosyltransferase family 2 protein n=1 Tax=uncultured Serinicoccus sp. TaxID=735514 RepID=UPI0026219C5E|nr:galactosyltransferase-related protein [uncultured Serinicoccus sp.]